MKTLLSVVAFTVLCLAQSASTPEQDVQPREDGFYYKSPDGWQKLQPISMAGGGLKHAGKMFVPGLIHNS